jgi:Kdo2-lipid IVA lauroyltransferase/acyltransferase
VAKKKPYRIFLYLFLRVVAGLVYILPRPIALGLARNLSHFAYGFIHRQREKTIENLRRAFSSEKSEQEIQAIAKKVFENFALTGVEILQAPKFNRETFLEIVDGADEVCAVYDSILAEGKGLLSITAHIGNWELLGGFVAFSGYPLSVLARRIYYEPYNKWIVGIRSGLKMKTIYRDDSSRQILKILERNEIVGLLPDQDMDRLKGIFVPFFGRPAYTAIAPVRLSITSGAPILPNFLVRTKGDRYRVLMGKPIRPIPGVSRDEAVQRMTEDWMSQFEKVIREYPEQWGWMHNRWKTQIADKEQEIKR